MAKIPILDDLLIKATSGQDPKYGRLAMKIYLRVFLLVFGKAFPYLLKGLWNALKGNSEERKKAFLGGTKVWAEDAIYVTKSEVKVFNEINPPEKGHFIFLNHVNEMDFPYDCLVMRKPYLANQVIKKTLFAYWWMLAMGSQVFDNSKARTIAISVRNLIKGLKETSYIVYPEGRNTYTEEIQPIKKGMIKIAFEENIPIYLALKSGVASYQKVQSGNKIGYLGVGYFYPKDFATYSALQDAIQAAMEKAKKELDALTAGMLNPKP